LPSTQAIVLAMQGINLLRLQTKDNRQLIGIELHSK
jgi:hypothetical protein